MKLKIAKKYGDLIVNGEKTVELRKIGSIAERLEFPLKIKLFSIFDEIEYGSIIVKNMSIINKDYLFDIMNSGIDFINYQGIYESAEGLSNYFSNDDYVVAFEIDEVINNG